MSYIFEWLIAEGHSEKELWECSAEKLELFYEMAQERRAREEWINDLRDLCNMHSAIGACITTEGHEAFSKRLDELGEKIGITKTLEEPKDVKRNRRDMAMRLQAIGAKLGQ